MIDLDEATNHLADTVENPKQVAPAFEDYNFDARWWTAPIDKIQKRLAKIKEDTEPMAVLVTTGAFCPIHQGHVQLLDTAKRELESRGIAVLGGYICPDHDQYVSSKIRSGSLSAAQRLALCELAVEESDWLMVDRWAAIYASSSVSFTTIVGHIDKMIKKHIKTTKPIQIVCAFGGDNGAFAFSFVAKWSCICVLRPGSADVFNDMTSYGSLLNNPRIIFSRDVTAPLDSTSVRKGDLSGLLPKVKEAYLSMQRANGGIYPTERPGRSPSKHAIYLRNEGPWAIQPFLRKVNHNSSGLLQAYYRFCEQLREVFELASEFGSKPELINLEDQNNGLNRLLSRHDKIISLDPRLSGSHDLYIWHVSRPLVEQSNAIAAPQDKIPAEKQLYRADPGAYILVSENLPIDAETMDLVSEQLSNGCEILKHVSALDLLESEAEQEESGLEGSESKSYNASDFLLGSQGGTVLQLSEQCLVSAPSIIPYVRPSHRTHVDVAMELGFSKAVWELNRRFFQAIGDSLTVSDMAEGSQALWEMQGFPLDMLMTDLCDWHLAAFEDMSFEKIPGG